MLVTSCDSPVDQAQCVDFLSPTDFTVGKTPEFLHSLFPFLGGLNHPLPLRSPLIQYLKVPSEAVLLLSVITGPMVNEERPSGWLP